MEVKINKEICNYTESMFFGLPLRKFIFSLLACGVAVGFIKYNGMTAEQFVWAWIKSEFLMPKKLLFLPDNFYYETLKTTISNKEKEALKK